MLCYGMELAQRGNHILMEVQLEYCRQLGSFLAGTACLTYLLFTVTL